MDPPPSRHPNQNNRHPQRRYRDHQVPTKRGHHSRRNESCESISQSSESHIPTHRHTRWIEGDDHRSPISSLNSTLSKKLGRLNDVHDANRTAHSFHDETADFLHEPTTMRRGQSHSSNSLGGMVKSRSRTNNSFDGGNHGMMCRSRSSRDGFPSNEYNVEEMMPPRRGGERHRRVRSKSRPSFNNNNINSFEDYLVDQMESSWRKNDTTRRHPSSNTNSLNPMMKSSSRNSFHQDNNNNDYLVGEEVQIHPIQQRHNTSYNNLLYDTTSDDSVKDTSWSMAQSAFSMLPQHRRISTDVYSDGYSYDINMESPSSSIKGGYSSQCSSSQRGRTVSRSSSIHSHLSSQSQTTTTTGVRRQRYSMGHTVPMNPYESDDNSLDSLLSGQEELIDSNCSRESSDGSTRQRGDAVSFSDNKSGMHELKLFDLEGLDCIEFDPSENEDNESHLSDSLDGSSHSLDPTEERPWYIRHFEEEGLFDIDTSTAYDTKMPTKHQFGRDVHHELAKSMGDAVIEEEEKKAAEKLGACDTSTVDLEDDVGDWEERLWAIARKHYKEYNALLDDADDAASVAKSCAASVPTLSDEMTAEEQEQLFNEDFELEQKGVYSFRLVLMICIKAYVEAFHGDLSKSDVPKERVDETTDDPDDGWAELDINLDIDRYVPLVTARNLFEEVLKLIDDGKISLRLTGTAVDPRVLKFAEKRAQFIASILTDDELYIFRKYEVVTVQDSPLTSAANQSIRKLTSSATNTNLAQEYLDTDLYGDLDEKEEKEDTDRACHDGNTSLETRECEIRLRSALITLVSGKTSDSLYTGDVWWPNVARKVIILGISSKPLCVEGQESLVNVDPVASLKHSEPLAKLYSLHHAPKFLLRAFLQGSEEVFDVNDPKNLLFDTAYIESKLDLQGPYNAVISHLSNFRDYVSCQSNIGRCKYDDNQEYQALQELIVSCLIGHLEKILKPTGYKLQRFDSASSAVDDARDGTEKSTFAVITIHNYSNIVASCLEAGRALHHLGLCVGRRQRDQASSEESTTDITVTLEIEAYRTSLEAYKACMFIFSEVEQSSSGRGKQDEFQQTREAKTSVELHLADVLTAVGYCHDTKLNEYESALMAYRESLSLYIRHIGRFHRIVSNTLHNMGTIHTELKQWSEAASCYRQCLSIIKRKEEQERAAWIKSHGIGNSEDEALVGSFISSMNQDIVCTLECLAGSLSSLGEYDASLVCLEQAIERQEDKEETEDAREKKLKTPNAATAELHSKAANIFLKQAFEISFSLNREYDSILFSNKTAPNIRLLQNSLIKKEQSAKDSIEKAIMLRRQHWYVNRISITSKAQLKCLAEDLVTAGRLEFRKQSYTAAISYLYEALAVNMHSIKGRHSLDQSVLGGLRKNASSNSGSSLLKVTDDVLSIVNSIEEFSDGLTMQILYLIGISHERLGQDDKAKDVLYKAHAAANILSEHSTEQKSSLEKIVYRLCVTTCEVRLVFLSDTVETGTSSDVSLRHIIESLNSLIKVLKSDEEDMLDNNRNRIEMIINTQLANAWHLHGKHLTPNDPPRAIKCFQKTVDLLKRVHNIRLTCRESATNQSHLPFPSLWWEESSALGTVSNLCDTYQYLGELNSDKLLSSSHLQRAIESREIFASHFGSMTLAESENSLECFDVSSLDFKNMKCYKLLLEIINSGGGSAGDNTEEKSPKSQEYNASDAILTKEDVLVRLGSLQAKLGLVQDAIESFHEAEKSIVYLLGTRDHEIVSNLFFNMGNAYRQLAISSVTSGEKEIAKEKAVECYSESIRISSSIFGNRHISVAESILNQGLIYMGEEHCWFNVLYEEKDEEEDNLALEYLKRSLQIRRKNKDDGNGLDLASTLYLLGTLLLRLIGRNSLRLDADTSKLSNEAVTYLIEALKIRNLLLGEDHIDVARTLLSLGQAYLYRAIGSRNKSIKSDDLGKAFETLNSVLGLLDFADPGLSNQLAKAHGKFLLGYVEEMRGHYVQAKALFTSAIRLLQKGGSQVASEMKGEILGRYATLIHTVNLLAARVLNHIAIVRKEEGSLQDSVSLLKKCVQIRKSCGMVKHDGVTVASFEFHLANALFLLEMANESIGHYSHTLRIGIRYYGKDSLNVAESLFGMGQAFSFQSRYQKALLCFDKAMRIYEFKEQITPKERLGDLHREIGHNLLRSGGDLHEILEHYRSSVSYLEASNGVNEICDKLVNAYTEMLAIMRDVFDTEGDEVAKAELLDELSDVLHRLGNLYASSGEHNDAMIYFTEVLDIQQRRNIDREELRIADLLFNMGNIYVELNLPKKALKCLEESLTITKEALGEDHQELHSTFYLMGVAFWDLEDHESSLEWFTQALSVLDVKGDEEIDAANKGRTMYRLGQICEELGRNSSALSYYQNCSKILKITHCNKPELSGALLSMGKLHQYNSDHEDALSCFDQSLRISIELGDITKIANIKILIGLVLSDIGEMDRSLIYLANALQTKTNECGDVGFDLGRVLMNIGYNYLSLGQHDLAQNFFEAAVSKFEGNSAYALDTAVCLYSIGVLIDENSEEGSLEYYLNAIQTFRENDAKTNTASLALGLQRYDIVYAKCLHQIAKVYVHKKNCADALEYMKESYAMQRDAFGDKHARTAESQHWLGIIYLALDQDDLALREFKSALKTRVSLFGTEHKSVAESLCGLAEVHFKRDELSECLECITENLRLHNTQSLQSDHSTIARSKLMLGSCYQELGRYSEAKENLSESLNILVDIYGGDRNLDIADAHFRLGICDCESNEYDSSMDHFKAAAAIRSSMLGDLDIECANSYESLGIVQQKSLLHDEAVTSFEKALAIKRASLHEIDEDIAVLLHFIGTSLFSLEKYDEALHFFTSSADIKQEIYGKQDQDYAMTLLDKAAALAKVGDDEQSMETYSKAIKSGLPLDSWELGMAYKNVAKYMYEQNDIDASLDSYSEAVSIFEWIIENELPAPSKYNDVIECYVYLLEMNDHPISEERGLTCYKLANCYVQVSNLEDAISMYREAIMIQTQIFGVNHVSVANALHNLGNCYRDYGDFNKSEECLTKALGILTLSLGDEHEDVADTCHCLGVTLMARSEFHEAIPLLERALSIRKKQLGLQHVSTASSLYNLALVFQVKGSWVSAIKYCKEALKIQRASLGENNAVTMSTLLCAGRIHYGKGDFENAIRCFRSSFEQGNMMILRELGLVYKDRGEHDKSVLMFTEAAAHMVEILRLDSAGDDLFSSLSARKQQTKEQDLIKLADDIMHFGSVVIHLDRLNDALSCFRVSNAIYQAKYISSDHLTIAENLHRTGHVLERISSHTSNNEPLTEALEVIAEAVRIRRVHLEPSHPDLAESLFILAKIHHRLGNAHDAAKTLSEAIESRGIMNTQFVDYETLLQIGHMQKEYGRYQEALGTFEECLEIKSRLVETRTTSVAELQFFIGDILREIGEFDSSESRFKESLAILEVTKSELINAADVYFSLGILFTEQEKYNLALDSYMQSLQGRKLETSTTKIDMAELLNNIGICYCGMKEYVKAQVYHAEALESLIEELGYDHPDVAFCWHSLGTVHSELNDMEEALSCFKNAAKIERTEIYLQSLGICLVRVNDYEDAFVCLTDALQMKNVDHQVDDDTAEIQRHLGIIWMKREKYEEALSMFEQALKIKASLPPEEQHDRYHTNMMECFDMALESVEILFGSGHLRYAKLLHQKGNIHGAKGEHSLAVEAYIITLRIYKQHYGDSHLSVANSMFNLGVSLNAKGSPDKGLRCFVKALRISKSKLGDDHLDVADTFEQMAISSKLMMDYNEAIIHFEKSLSIRKNLLAGGGDLKAAAIMQEMGVAYQKESNLESAERAFKESLRLRTSKLGQEDVLVAESMHQLASLYYDQGELASALRYFEDCLRIYISHSGASKLVIADVYFLIGGIHNKLGNTNKALRSYDKSMSIFSEKYGHKHERVVSCLAHKGRVLHECGEHSKALSCFSECLERTRLLPQGCDTSLAKDRAYALSQMGMLYSKIGNVAEASSHFSLALAAYRSMNGPEHSTVAEVLQNMARLFVENGEFERGYSCAKEALAMKEKMFGPNDSESNYFMGKILFECGKYSEAAKYMERARKIHSEEFGKRSSQVAEDNLLLGMICEKIAAANSNSQEESHNDLDCAVQYLQDALSAKRNLLEKNDPEICTILTRLGHAHYKLGEYDKSVDCLSESLQICETNRDSTPASQLLVADALFDLGAALNKARDTKRALNLFTDALREYQVLLDKNHLNIAKCLGSIGEVHEKENELTEAISYLEEAASIYEQNFGGGEPNDKAIKSSNSKEDYAQQADILFVLATAYDRMGNETSSLKLYRNILKIYKALFGRDSIHVAKVLNRLANMKGKTGSVEKAMVLFDESLRIRMLHFGNNHEDVAETLFGMGIVFEKRKNYPAAMKAYSDCLRIRSSRFGSDSMEVAQVVVNIGVVRGNKGDFSGALKSWQKALAIYRKHGLEDDHALVAAVLGHQDLALNLIKNRGRSRK